ncbi:MAG TPA: hypothetical protein VF131_18005 [Blastocatellia bacterium]|nr:hypothetical protein [Blastocatellia bacterium]
MIWFNWIKANLPLVAAIAGLLVFIIYDRRKKSLEIKKLELEIKKLKDETLIYRPTFQEIKDILEETEHIATRGSKAFGSEDHLEDFGVALHHFLTHLLGYYGDSSSHLRVQKQRLYAIMNHLPDPYGKDFKEIDFPDPEPIVRKWREVRHGALSQLSSRTIEEIDLLLNRFASATTAA